jgi:hypothetical protein
MPRLPATLEPVRFGEFLRDRNLISDEQWLAALAAHWSAPKRRRIGNVIVEAGFLPAEIVEAQARAFHDELDIVEVADVSDLELDLAVTERSEKPTVPLVVPAF